MLSLPSVLAFPSHTTSYYVLSEDLLQFDFLLLWAPVSHLAISGDRRSFYLMKKTFDVIVVGAGEAASAGKKVA